jgi:hypothetical protein
MDIRWNPQLERATVYYWPTNDTSYRGQGHKQTALWLVFASRFAQTEAKQLENRAQKFSGMKKGSVATVALVLKISWR